jgi:hypothetical protein
VTENWKRGPAEAGHYAGPAEAGLDAGGGEAGFSIVEALISTAVLLVVSATVMRGVLGMTDISTTVSNRTDMHNGVRNATELLTQEVGQAGRISLPGTVTLSAGAGVGTTTLNVSSTAAGDETKGMFVGEILVLDTGPLQESVEIATVGTTSITITEALESAHAAGAPVSVLGGFSNGVIPSAPGVTAGSAGLTDGSTGTVLKIFGDIHDDGNMVYVEYTCNLEEGRLYRNSMPFDTGAGAKTAPGVEEILIDNIEANPGGTPCFTYQEETFDGTTYVVGVAITLTVKTRDKDKYTADYQRETKALLNVSPRNVFNVWQMASLQYYDRIQTTPPTVTALLPELTGGVTGQTGQTGPVAPY